MICAGENCCGACNYIRGPKLTVEETRVAMQAVKAFRRAA